MKRILIWASVLHVILCFGTIYFALSQGSRTGTSTNNNSKRVATIQNPSTSQTSPGTGGGGPSSGGGSGPRKRAARVANDAARVFAQIMSVPDMAIPKELLDKAEAVVVFPGVVKGSFIVGGQGGQGVVSRRVRGGWSQPAFLNLGGGSIGAQIGAQKTDYVLLIMNQEGFNALLEDKFEVGTEASIAAGPIGRTAAASTNATLDAGILSYSRSKGAFAGVSLNGAVIGHDNNLNQAVYGKDANELLSNPAMTIRQTPSEIRIFPQTLSQYSRR